MTTAPAGDALIALYPILATLTARTRQRLEARAQFLELPAGTTVFDERQACRGFPFVISGSIRVVKAAPNGRELPLYRVTPGETCIISSACLLGQAPYNARGVTEADTTLLVVPNEDFQALLGEQAFRDFVFQLFSERIADLMQLIEEVAFRKLDQRLAALLLGKGQRLHTTHQQLADELGSVREIVSRLLKGLAEQGLVALSREQIEILDPAGLRRLAGG
ncbi:Crp/Fnr family transcriptional regulator [Zoogloea sp.]|jgi:CRP/FNR family transcriptional regulator|uniref:Crp/Fnr family transcriptional regulator n=1 Tax=Zoogloea sp. TaxID=49181 RepID=UPI001B3F64C1|nr:Crp/Fnr family transcriptional regulator [Zoogloea sp.]MBK6656346.1 Crp/Fnr family transcriptional regulator [Zoogloea sp.]MBK7845939.1 Crp/Fnr family transcriptional regulator [Zoogloea sp.]MBP7444948.1 Crp/Fnr family transcriptional regulator [Zoogloea sp.]HOY00369.1 Crp/Fnr family transcriptional regulator [Zoogloea sp.]HPI62294.1 Crp/Fnr family transcriptional regulator [Zoogloea sp.]